MLTVKQLSKLAGISPRTLHYYDEIGLLHPSQIGSNGYRYYDDNCVLRLQQILLYRELDLPLEQIKKITSQPAYDNVAALINHKQALQKRITRLKKLVETVEDTIQFIQGDKTMSKKQLFAALSQEDQEKMEEEALQMYDPQVVKDSHRNWKNYNKLEQDRILAEGNEITRRSLIHGTWSEDPSRCRPNRPLGTSHRVFLEPKCRQLLVWLIYNYDHGFKANFDKFDPHLRSSCAKQWQSM